MTSTDLRISVIGLGKLGSPLAACLASKGYSVVGIDVDPEKVNKLNEAQAPVFEPGLSELLAESSDRISATMDISAVAETDITFLVVATPSEDHGGFSLRYVIPACEAIGEAIASKDTYHLVVLTSTVMPGATGREVREALERASGKVCGVDFGLCYSPEFIALGSVIRDFLNPDFVLIGESDRDAGDLLSSIYLTVCGEVPFARSSFVNAEIAKLAVNTFVTTKIEFANMLARLCEGLPGADVDEVTAAIGLDSRIGSRYLKGAISYGGPCFPRDNMALAMLARAVGSPALVAEATDTANREQIRRLALYAMAKLPEGGRVGVLGLSYKPNTDVVEESPGLLLAQELAGQGVEVVAYDPAAMGSARRVLDSTVSYADSMDECLREAEVVVLATPWSEFKTLETQLPVDDGRRRSVIDCWRLLDGDRMAEIADYVPLGRGLSGESSELELDAVAP